MNTELYGAVGKRIKETRIFQGYSRSKLAEKAGISDKFLYEIEMGKKGFSSDVLYRISDVLGVSCDYILKGSQRKENDNSELMAVIECFDKRDIQKLGALVKMIYEYKSEK